MIDKLKKRSVLLICTMFITALISNEFLTVIGLRERTLTIFLMAAAAVFLIEFITYNKKTVLVSLGIAAASVLFYYVYIPVFSDISMFISSVIDQIYNKIFWADRSFFISELISIFIICFIVGFSVHFLYTRAQSTIFSMMGLMTYIFSLQFFFELEKSEIYLLSFSSMIVVLILWTYKNFDKVRMLKSYKIWVKYMSPVVCVLLAATFILTSIVNIEENDKIIKWINDMFTNLVNPVDKIDSMFFLDGFEKNNGVIGGNVDIKNKYQFDLTVESMDGNPLKSGSYYLRGVSCDIFDAKNSKWETNIDDGQKKNIDDYIEEKRFFGSDIELTFYDNFLSSKQEYYQTQRYIVSGQNQSVKTLFHPLMLYSIFTNPQEGIFYDKSGYVHIDKDRKIESYRGSSVYIGRDENFDEYVNSFNGIYTENKDEINHFVRAALEDYYLQVPNEIPSGVKELAEEITNGCLSDYEKASAIEQYMKENYEYTLTPGKVPKDKDIVSYFLLESKKGYCTYYATAMTMLCRSLGIPARYVRGYRVDNLENNVNTPVYSKNLHAWVEVYIYRFGWITFDPVSAGNLPGPGPNQNTVTPAPPLVTPAPSETITETETQLVTITPTEPATGSITKSPPASAETGNTIGKILMTACIIIAAAVLIIGGLLLKKRMIYLKSIKKTPAELFEKFVRVRTYEGYKWEEGETVAAYFAKFKDPGYDKLAGIFEKCFYAEGSLSDEEYIEIVNLLKDLEKNAAYRDGKLNLNWYKFKRNYKMNINRFVKK